LPKSSHYTILLIKAGTTSWDDEERLCGATDLPSTEQALNEITRNLQSVHGLSELRSQMDLVLTGPSDTSMQCVKKLVGSSDAKIKIVDELAELDLGLWEGVLRTDLEERFPSVYTQWIAQPGMVAPPDGESLEAVQDRVLSSLFKVLGKLKSEHPIVGLVLRPYSWAVIKCWLDQRPLSEVWGYLEGDSGIESFSLDRDMIEGNLSRKSKIA
jgi:broad specificity phosphatase PhoE